MSRFKVRMFLPYGRWRHLRVLAQPKQRTRRRFRLTGIDFGAYNVEHGGGDLTRARTPRGFHRDLQELTTAGEIKYNGSDDADDDGCFQVCCPKSFQLTLFCQAYGLWRVRPTRGNVLARCLPCPRVGLHFITCVGQTNVMNTEYSVFYARGIPRHHFCLLCRACFVFSHMV